MFAVGKFQLVSRPRMLFSLAVSGLTVACVVAGCGAANHGAFLKMINNTTVTVMMRSCTGDYAADQRCSAPQKIAPRGSAEFSLPPKNAPMKEVKITGYDRQPLCFMVPPRTLPAGAYAVVDVTQVQPGNCLGSNG